MLKNLTLLESPLKVEITPDQPNSFSLTVKLKRFSVMLIPHINLEARK